VILGIALVGDLGIALVGDFAGVLFGDFAIDFLGDFEIVVAIISLSTFSLQSFFSVSLLSVFKSFFAVLVLVLSSVLVESFNFSFFLGSFIRYFNISFVFRKSLSEVNQAN